MCTGINGSHPYAIAGGDGRFYCADCNTETTPGRRKNRKVSRRAFALREEYQHLRGFGWSLEKIALRLGYQDPDGLLKALGDRELSEWLRAGL